MSVVSLLGINTSGSGKEPQSVMEVSADPETLDPVAWLNARIEKSPSPEWSFDFNCFAADYNSSRYVYITFYL